MEELRLQYYQNRNMTKQNYKLKSLWNDPGCVTQLGVVCLQLSKSLPLLVV